MTGRRKEARLEAIGALCRIARRAEFDIGVRELRERVIEFVGPKLDLRFLADRGLKQREGIGLLIHRPLDALHQRRVDLSQLVDGPSEVCQIRMVRRAVIGHGGSGFSIDVANAMPVSVWFKCMALNCSPYVWNPATP